MRSFFGCLAYMHITSRCNFISLDVSVHKFFLLDEDI